MNTGHMTITKLILDSNKAQIKNFAVRVRDLNANVVKFRSELERASTNAIKDGCYTGEIERAYTSLFKQTEEILSVLEKANEDISRIAKEGN